MRQHGDLGGRDRRAGVVLVLLPVITLALQGCGGSASPSQERPGTVAASAGQATSSSRPAGDETATAGPQSRVDASAPPRSPGTVARVEYRADSGEASSRSFGATQPGQEYVVRSYCGADDPQTVVEYAVTLRDSEDVISGGVIPCDGSIVVNTALKASDLRQEVEISFVGGLDGVRTAVVNVEPG